MCNYRERLSRVAPFASGREVVAENIVPFLEAVIEPGDRVCIEGNNQKQADFLAKSLVKTDPARVRDLHLVQSVLALPEHIELIERGQVKRIDFCFSGPQAVRLAKLVEQGRIEIGAIHTYLELYARYFTGSYAQGGADCARWLPITRATCTPARTPRTHRPSSKPPPSRAVS